MTNPESRTGRARPAPHLDRALRRIKGAVFSAAARVRLFDAFAGSEWRRRRLAVLCYHGVSIADEHEWRPALFVSAAFFRRRLEMLRRKGYVVLSLDEACTRLAQESLPRRAVVLTFDDGTYDFYSVVWPILQEYGYPATVYWTTYYAQRPFPVFSVAYSYLQWKANGALPAVPPAIAAGNGAEKDGWLQEVCSASGVRYEDLIERRILSIMQPHEVSELATAGCDIQLHTHRHRMPLEEAAFRDEIASNRAVIQRATGQVPRHFCYPRGKFRGRFLPWLESEGIQTATTTQPGVVGRRTPRLLMPRLVDHTGLSEAEFEAWTSGVAGLLPHRTFWSDPDAA